MDLKTYVEATLVREPVIIPEELVDKQVGVRYALFRMDLHDGKLGFLERNLFRHCNLPSDQLVESLVAHQYPISIAVDDLRLVELAKIRDGLAKIMPHIEYSTRYVPMNTEPFCCFFDVK